MPIHSNGYRLLNGRYSEPGRIYAVTVVTDQRRPIFTDFHLGRLLVKEMKLAHEEGSVSSLAWVIMPEHFHWLFELQEKPLPQVMCRVKSRSSLSINQSTKTSGRLWQKGYHDRAIRKEDDLRTIARYIVANPLRAGLVRKAGEYALWDASWL
ncbi:transposase [Pseudomonas sp. CCM 7893]|uniref:Transposase n=1 Tax=Pseudomonas spelaei TaxID=1055469 RepID=A0A6I3W8M9_9PSED|nr:transposase [Pseudomonas spelaei]MUF03502.1 transposase [Pseudomonas spelaei]